MTERILAVLFVFISSVISATGYVGIALLMAIESACIPLPSELIMPFAGYLVFTGTFKLLWVATAGALGCNLGSLVAYEIGFFGGRPLVERYGRWILMGRRELNWADRFFAHWGVAHATRTLSCLYIPRIVALVPGAGLSRDEARPKLAGTREVFSQVRRCNWRGAARGRGLFCLDSLAEQDQAPGVSA
jgi:membrane protein DedA with SNARE-associated domain